MRTNTDYYYYRMSTSPISSSAWSQWPYCPLHIRSSLCQSLRVPLTLYTWAHLVVSSGTQKHHRDQSSVDKEIYHTIIIVVYVKLKLTVIRAYVPWRVVEIGLLCFFQIAYLWACTVECVSHYQLSLHPVHTYTNMIWIFAPFPTLCLHAVT